MSETCMSPGQTQPTYCIEPLNHEGGHTYGPVDLPIREQVRRLCRDIRVYFNLGDRHPICCRICSKIEFEILCTEGRSRKEVEARVTRIRARKDGAYTERNRVVAYLASMFPSSLERHTPNDQNWDKEWLWVVYIDHPEGQLSWHIHDSHLPFFDHVERGNGKRSWDGHTTEEKYQRLAQACKK